MAFARGTRAEGHPYDVAIARESTTIQRTREYKTHARAHFLQGDRLSIASILLPVFVQVALIFTICFRMIYARNSKLGAGDAEWGKLAGNSFRNQFEIPVLFFALIPLAMLTRQAGYMFVVMEWIFVLSRIAHAFVHVTSNRQPARGLLWLVGAVTLLAMWIIFALRIMLAPTVAPL